MIAPTLPKAATESSKAPSETSAPPRATPKAAPHTMAAKEEEKLGLQAMASNLGLATTLGDADLAVTS